MATDICVRGPDTDALRARSAPNARPKQRSAKARFRLFCYSSAPKPLVWPTLDLLNQTQMLRGGRAEPKRPSFWRVCLTTLTSFQSRGPRRTLDWRRLCTGSQVAPRLKLVFGAPTKWPLVELVSGWRGLTQGSAAAVESCLQAAFHLVQDPFKCVLP